MVCISIPTKLEVTGEAVPAKSCEKSISMVLLSRGCPTRAVVKVPAAGIYDNLKDFKRDANRAARYATDQAR